MIAVCPDCEGEGEVYLNPLWPDPQGAYPVPCGKCGGRGLVEDEESEPPPLPSGYTTREDYL